MDLSYVIERIKNSEITEFPFRHLEINELFKPEDFEQFINSPEIKTKAVKDDQALFEELFANDYRIIAFPGCTENHKEYIKWHKGDKTSQEISTSCEGFGVVMRLQSTKSEPMTTLQNFLNSKEFINCIAEKFDVKPEDCNYDAGIQKYLDGYEISPHPDIRRKALTYMVNMNPDPASSEKEHHTLYLQFKPEWNYVPEFWKGNENVDRCWVPWDWCDVKKQQRQNNSIVIFSPNNRTMHAVKASYNHLNYQRTQLYGNLWYKQSLTAGKPKWEDLLIGSGAPEASAAKNVRDAVKVLLPNKVTSALKKLRSSNAESTTHAKRNIESK